jgi:hypothetical protein
VQNADIHKFAARLREEKTIVDQTFRLAGFVYKSKLDHFVRSRSGLRIEWELAGGLQMQKSQKLR